MASFLNLYRGLKNKIMKFNILNWKMVPAIAVFGATILFVSCNNDDDSNNTTMTETDTRSTLTEPNANTNVTSAADSANRRVSSAKRTGKISVADNSASTSTGARTKMAMDKDGYYNFAEVSPSFSGGQRAIENYINNNIEYPDDAIDNNAEGTVNVEFGVDENGNISNVRTIGNKQGYGMDEAATEVVKGMSRWTPGLVNGKKVKTRMILPITFQLDQ
jgi:TonB family protein